MSAIGRLSSVSRGIKAQNLGAGSLWDRNGYTIIEIMIVITILGLLASLAVPLYQRRVERARVTSVKLELERLKLGLSLFHYDNGFYPSTEQGLNALIEEPSIGKIPCCYRRGGYWDGSAPLVDAWNNLYLYERDPRDQTQYVITSYGADGRLGGAGFNHDLEIRQ